MAHFDLVRVYGKTYTAPDAPNSLGIPVVTTVLGSDSKLIRNTVSEVYTQVIKDLNEAINSKAVSYTHLPKMLSSFVVMQDYDILTSPTYLLKT